MDGGSTGCLGGSLGVGWEFNLWGQSTCSTMWQKPRPRMVWSSTHNTTTLSTFWRRGRFSLGTSCERSFWCRQCTLEWRCFGTQHRTMTLTPVLAHSSSQEKNVHLTEHPAQRVGTVSECTGDRRRAKSSVSFAFLACLTRETSCLHRVC